MNVDKMKEQIESHFEHFLKSLGPEDRALLEKLKVNLEELFDKQKHVDVARKELGKDFDKLLSLYFRQFKTSKGFEYRLLADKIETKEKVFLRHLGADKLQYLKLILALRADLEGTQKRRGLLLA